MPLTQHSKNSACLDPTGRSAFMLVYVSFHESLSLSLKKDESFFVDDFFKILKCSLGKLLVAPAASIIIKLHWEMKWK